MLPHDFGDPDKCPARGRAGRLRQRPRFPSAGLPGSGGGQAWQQPLAPPDPESLAVAGRLIDSPARRRCTQQRAFVGRLQLRPVLLGTRPVLSSRALESWSGPRPRRRRVCRPTFQAGCHHSSAVIADSARACKCIGHGAPANSLVQHCSTIPRTKCHTRVQFLCSNTVPLMFKHRPILFVRIEIDSLDSEFSETTPSATVLCRIRHEILYARCKKN
jgi:hypothetical protein